MLNSHLMNSLGLPQFVIKKANALLNLPNLAHKSEYSKMISLISDLWNLDLLFLLVMGRVSASLHLWPRGSEGEPGLRHLEGRAHVPDGGGQLVHVLLLVEDLLHGARQVRPQVGVSRVSVCDALLERSENTH